MGCLQLHFNLSKTQTDVDSTLNLQVLW